MKGRILSNGLGLRCRACRVVQTGYRRGSFGRSSRDGLRRRCGSIHFHIDDRRGLGRDSSDRSLNLKGRIFFGKLDLVARRWRGCRRRRNDRGIGHGQSDRCRGKRSSLSRRLNTFSGQPEILFRHPPHDLFLLLEKRQSARPFSILAHIAHLHLDLHRRIPFDLVVPISSRHGCILPITIDIHRVALVLGGTSSSIKQDISKTEHDARVVDGFTGFDSVDLDRQRSARARDIHESVRSTYKLRSTRFCHCIYVSAERCHVVTRMHTTARWKWRTIGVSPLVSKGTSSSSMLTEISPLFAQSPLGSLAS